MPEKVNLKTKTVLCIDNGMYTAFCKTLSRYFKEVLYYTEYKLPFPTIVKFAIGYGFEEMTRVVNLFEAVDKADVIFIPDIYLGDMSTYIQQSGKPVFGSMMGEELEMYRADMKRLIKKLDLPLNDYIEIKGLDNLRDYLRKHENKYIKTDVYRWDFETFHHKKYYTTEPRLDELEHKLGAAKHLMGFIVEDAIDGDDIVETGSDFLTIDGEFSEYISFGYEIKATMYAMQFKKASQLPSIITDFNDKISDTLRKYKYRCVGCTEIRVGKDKIPYMIDFTSRFGSPPCEIFSEAIINWGDIIWFGAKGILIQPEIKHKFGVQLFITSEWASHNWQPVYFPKEIEKWVKLRNACKIKDTNYVVPTESPLVGSVVAIGDSLEECYKVVGERAALVDGYEIDIKIGAIEEMKGIITKGEKIGIKFDK